MLALVATALMALGAGALPAPSGSKPVLAYASSPAATERPASWASAFRAMVARDLRGAGVFRLLEPAAEASPEGAPRDPAADWWLTTGIRPAQRGKALVECKCTRSGRKDPLVDRTFVADPQAWPRLAHRVADLVVGKVTGTPGIADSVIVFSRRTGPGASEIFEVDRYGQNLRKLTSFGSVASYPALAADGRLALVTFNGGPPQIWGQTRAMGPLQKLFPRRGDEGQGISDLCWSPDGTRLAFILENRRGTAALEVLDPESGKTATLTTAEHRAKSPSWNPQGTALAYVSDQDWVPQVFIVDAAGSHPRQVTRDAAPKRCAVWAPTGDRIGCGIQAGGRTVIMTVKPDGAEPRQLASLTQPVESLCWAPDGRGLLLGLKQAQDCQLAIVDMEGASQPFAEGLRGSQCPQWTRAHPRIALLSPADSPAAHPDHAPPSAPSPF